MSFFCFHMRILRIYACYLEHCWSVYHKVRNHVTKLARKANTNFLKSVIQNSEGDFKTMWSHVDKLFPKTKSSGFPSPEINGRLITLSLQGYNQ